MIDLTDHCGFSVKYDELRGKLLMNPENCCENEEMVYLREMVPSLLNKSVKYPEKVYKHHKGVVHDDKTNQLRYDLVFIPYGLLGIEFIKTHIFYTPEVEGKYACTIEAVTGDLVVMMQKNAEKESPYQFDTMVEEAIIVSLKIGDKLSIPTGMMYTFVNVGMTPVIFSKVTRRDAAPLDYNTIQREKGLAYYIISKNAKVEAVANPKYKLRNKLIRATAANLFKKEELNLRYGMINSVLGEKESLFSLFRNKGKNVAKFYI